MSVRVDKVQVDVEINGKAAGKTLEELEKESRQLVRELRKMDPATEAFVKKSKDLKDVKGKVGDIKQEMFGLDKATKGTMQTFQEMNPYQQMFAKWGSTFGMVKGKVTEVSKSFKSLDGLLKFSAIGIVVGLLGVLITYLKSTQSGMDKVTAVTRPLMAIFERLIGVAQELGGKVFKALADAVSNPKQALIDLSDVIKNNVMKRLEGFGMMGKAIAKVFSKDWKEGLKDLGNASLQAATGVEDIAGKMKNAAEGVSDFIKEGWQAGTQLDQLQKQIERAEIETIKRRRELEKIAKEQNYIVEDETNSYNERRAAAEAALKAQEELQTIQIDLIDKKIAKMQAEQALNDTSRENEKELAELMAQRDEITASVVEMRTTTRNKLNILNKAEAADHQKMIDAKRKAEESLTDLRIALMEDATERGVAELNRRFEKEIAAFAGTEEQKTEFMLLKEQERQQALAQLKEEGKRQEYERLLKTDQELEEMDKLRLEEKFLNALLTDEAYNQAQLDQSRAHMETRLALIEAQHGSESLEYQKQQNAILAFDKERVDKQIENEQRLSEAKQQIMDFSTQAFADTLALTVEFLGKDEAARKKNAQLIKDFETAKVFTNLFGEISAIWKNANSNPLNALIPGSGNVIAGVQTALAAGRATLAVQKINAEQFAGGGIVYGPSHAQGGIAMIDRRTGKEVGEMEGNEIILTGGVTSDPALRAAASRINVAGGGRTFEAGGPINPYITPQTPGTAADAALASPTGASASAGNQAAAASGAASYTALINEVRGLRGDVQNMQTRLKAYVVYSEIEDAGNQVSEVRSDAAFGG